MAETPALPHEPYAASRTKALESLLLEKGLLTTEFIDSIVRRYEAQCYGSCHQPQSDARIGGG